MMELITPNSSSYSENRQLWNLAIQKYPAIIAYCKTVKDVRKAVLDAQQKHLKIRIRSGGHNYEGYSIANEAYVIDISSLNKVQINYANQTVTAQGGVNNSQLYSFVASKGYAFPGGACPTVGVSGYVLGGGWGYSSRYLGLGCDSLLEITLVDYKGCLITANQTTHADLFWACRGAGGGNFGVVVSMTFKLPPKVANVTLFDIRYPSPTKDIQVQFLDAWQNWIQTITPKVNMKGGIYNSASLGVYIACSGLFYGTPEELNKRLIPFSTINGYTITSEYTSFLQAINKIASTYPLYEHFKSSGRFVVRNYSTLELLKLVNMINQNRPIGSIMTALNIYGLGGKVREMVPSDTAFYYRNSHYILLVQSVFKNNIYKDENVRWVSKNYRLLSSMTTGSYINFPFYPLQDYIYEYYGENASALQCIKQHYDPFDVFSFQQSIK